MSPSPTDFWKNMLSYFIEQTWIQQNSIEVVQCSMALLQIRSVSLDSSVFLVILNKIILTG